MSIHVNPLNDSDVYPGPGYGWSHIDKKWVWSGFPTAAVPEGHKPTDIKGYRNLSPTEVGIINKMKEQEASLLRILNDIRDAQAGVDQRWLAIGRTHIEQGFMAIIRAIARPGAQ